MALVAYDDSDTSDHGDDDENSTVVCTSNGEHKTSLKLPKPVHNQARKEEEVEESYGAPSAPSLFNLLPNPSNKKPAVLEEDDEFLHKKEDVNVVKPKAKITVPSLNDFKDVDSSMAVAKPRVPNGKQSGLLSMLPQPKNGVTSTTRSLIPNILTKKPLIPKTEPTTAPKKANVNSVSLINGYSDSEDDGDEFQNDFFSIHKPVQLPDTDVPLDVEPTTSTQVTKTTTPRSIESYFKKEDVNHVHLEPDDYCNGVDNHSEPGPSVNENGIGTEHSNSNEIVLDDEAILKLCGSRGKRKREEIQIVDVNQQEVLADAREMLLKGLMDDTSKRVSASKRKGNEPTSQQKRKHQITYLAYQAKANEAELQNQWANNRMSRRQTQAKYGF